jgi:hypothetical protein
MAASLLSSLQQKHWRTVGGDHLSMCCTWLVGINNVIEFVIVLLLIV